MESATARLAGEELIAPRKSAPETATEMGFAFLVMDACVTMDLEGLIA